MQLFATRTFLSIEEWVRDRGREEPYMKPPTGLLACPTIYILALTTLVATSAYALSVPPGRYTYNLPLDLAIEAAQEAVRTCEANGYPLRHRLPLQCPFLAQSGRSRSDDQCLLGATCGLFRAYRSQKPRSLGTAAQKTAPVELRPVPWFSKDDKTISWTHAGLYLLEPYPPSFPLLVGFGCAILNVWLDAVCR